MLLVLFIFAVAVAVLLGQILLYAVEQGRRMELGQMEDLSWYDPKDTDNN